MMSVPADPKETASEALPRRADAVRNRERVIKAAEEIFTEHGIEAGIPEIAERAGVGKGTVYRNFETKDDLISAVLIDRSDRFNEALLVALEKEDAWKAFRQVLRDAVVGKMRNGNFGLTWQGESAALLAAREKTLELMDQLMKGAKRQGQMRKDARASDLSVLFGGVCRVLMERGVDDPKVWRRHVDQVVDAFRA